MPQYLLSVHHPIEVYNADSRHGAYASEADMNEAMADTGAFNQGLIDDGYFVFAGGLQPPESATTVDGQGEKVVSTDGPFAESKEYLGGFWVIEAPDLDVALELAAAGSKACRAKVEVRPFQTL